MATNSNVYSQGGGGGVYENEVQTGFFISMLLGMNIPGTQEGLITYFRQQSGSLGYQTDDLLLKCIEDDVHSRILMQIKHNLVISAKGQMFQEVIQAAWKDFKNKELFSPATDKIFIVKSNLTLDEKNHLKVVLDWARLKKSAHEDFTNEVAHIQQKKKYFDLIKDIIVAIEPDGKIDQDIYIDFLKCIYLLELDYGTDNSQHKAMLYSLMNNYKRDTDVTAGQIWSNISSELMDSNSQGGVFEKKRLPDEFRSIFDTANYDSEVRLLRRFSNQKAEILSGIENTIGNYSLKRDTLMEEIRSALNATDMVVISGDPGTGKSAVARSVISDIEESCDGFILNFKSDELGSGTLSGYLNQYGIRHSLEDIFSLFGLFNSNLIYIDAMEKLLEAEGQAANQLLSSIKAIKNVKVLITCRKSNLGLIEMKYLSNHNYSKIEIGTLTDDELERVYHEVPKLRTLSSITRLSSLIRVPKYLDFAFRAISQSGKIPQNINEADFRDLLWQTVIENRINEFNNGLPERRSRLFVDIAVNRSKQMRPFAPATLDDPLALEKLLKENVILESVESREFAPAHDVLEDWALIRYVDDCFLKQKTHDEFFKTLGQEPSMRRAYRLWVQSVLQTRIPAKLTFVMARLFDLDSQNYWRDESLVAILYSEYCTVFFETYRAELAKDNYQFLFKLIQIMRTACRENTGNLYQKNYIPTGHGWAPVFELLLSDFEKINDKNYGIIYQLINDWSKIVSHQEELPEGIRNVGLILLKLIGNYVSLDGYRRREPGSGVELLCLLAGGLVKEINAIIDGEDNDGNMDQDVLSENDIELDDNGSLKNKIIQVALSGSASEQLCKYLPDLVIGLADRHWLHKSCAVSYPKDDHDKMIYELIRRPSRSTEVEGHFGLKAEGRLEYFPASAYQTPIFWLLKYHPQKAVGFIVDIGNWCTQNYVASEFSKDDNVSSIGLTLSDGILVQQYGSDHLWSLYRGTGRVSPYLLQSVLMALEKYLLALSAEGEKNRDLINFLTDFLLRNSNNVMATGVIASLAQAYPMIADSFIPPLYSDQRLISYDIARFVHEPTSTMNTFKQLHDQERLASNNLPHRRKYTGGLKHFINFYSFNFGTANLQLFALFDKLRAAASPRDMQWLKTLDEMDIRTWRITKTFEEAEKTSLVIEPGYDEKLQQYVEGLKVERAKTDLDTDYFNWLHRVQKKDVATEIGMWRKIQTYYANLKGYSIVHHRPALVAEIGIRHLWAELAEEEKDWCKNIVFSTLEEKVASIYDPFDFDRMMSSMDFDSSINIFPLLSTLLRGEEQTEFESLVLYFLTAPFQENDPDATDCYKVFKTELWKLNESLAVKLFYGIIRFSEFYKTNRHDWRLRNSGTEQDNYSAAYKLLVESVVTGPETVPEVEKISWESHDMGYLIRAIKILPLEADHPSVYAFAEKLYNLCLGQMYKEEKSLEDKQMGNHLQWAIEDRLSDLLFWNQGKLRDQLFEHFIKSAHAFLGIILEDKSDKVSDFIKFFFSISERLIGIADRHLPIYKPEETEHTIKCFTSAWMKFDEISKALGSRLFGDTILLSWEAGWRQDATSWLPIDGQTERFKEYIAFYGENSIQAVVNLLSHIGDRTLLMPMLSWLIERLMSEKGRPRIMELNHIEQLVGRVYYNHLDEILQDGNLFADYLALLDEMISRQSSDAYWLREFIIHLNVKRG